MRFLTDEHIGTSVVEFLRTKSKYVYLARHELGPGASDPAIVIDAIKRGAIVVSCDRDFRALFEQVPVGHRRNFDRLCGRIELKQIPMTEIIERLRALWPVIASTERLARKRRQRLIMRVTKTSFTVTI